MKLEGRNALVTGASLGIGRAVAVELARQGANVGLNFRSNLDKAKEVAREIEQLGRKALILRADVADQKAVEDIVAKKGSEVVTISASASIADLVGR